MKKPFIISDKNKKSEIIKNKLEKKIKLTSLIKSDFIIVIGGDGFMLQTLKKYYKYKKPFYGINSGDYGFLMNKFHEKNIFKNFFMIPCLFVTLISNGDMVIRLAFLMLFTIFSPENLFIKKP